MGKPFAALPFLCLPEVMATFVDARSGRITRILSTERKKSWRWENYEFVNDFEASGHNLAWDVAHYQNQHDRETRGRKIRWTRWATPHRTLSVQNVLYGRISRSTGFIQAVPSAYLRLNVTWELLMALCRARSGMETPPYSTRVLSDASCLASSAIRTIWFSGQNQL